MHSQEPNTTNLFLADEAATAVLGRQLAACLLPGSVVYLDGDLGAGKTSLVRSMLRALGHQGPVKSPTYTLVEVYLVSSLYWYHFDFYRFTYPEEFVDAGLEEYFRNDSVCLVEWPDRAAGYVPAADVVVSLVIEGEGRRVTLSAESAEGQSCLNTFLTTPVASCSALPAAPPSSSL